MGHCDFAGQLDYLLKKGLFSTDKTQILSILGAAGGPDESASSSGSGVREDRIGSLPVSVITTTRTCWGRAYPVYCIRVVCSYGPLCGQTVLRPS